MEYIDFSLEAYKIAIYGQYTQPNEVRAVTVLVHGFGEHSGRYKEHVVPALLHSNSAVVLYDNIGHGQSGGKRGHCPNYEALLNILESVVLKARSFFPSIPIFLYGHSMGGNLVLNYVLQREEGFNAVIATSPYLRLAFKPPGWKMFLGKLMLHLMPSMTMASGLDPNGISRIPEEVNKYVKDPLVHDKVSPMFSFPIMDAGELAISKANELQIPTLLLHGTKDPIIDPGGTQEFHQNARTTTLKLFTGGFHELHNDLCREEVVETIQNWLQQQL